MKTKQFIVGLTLSAIMGGGVAVGSYKLLENNTAQNAQQEEVQYPNVRYTSTMRSSEDGRDMLAISRLPCQAGNRAPR